MKEELKPCPFCGCHAYIFVNNKNCYHVQCVFGHRIIVHKIFELCCESVKQEMVR